MDKILSNVSKVKVVEYSIKSLKSELNSDILWSNKVIPISKHKIVSHINNPRASEDDIALIVAYDDNNEIISYLGALPDCLNLNEINEKFAWLSCWWTNSNHVHSKYSIVLLFKMMKHYNNNIGISDFTVRAKEIYDSTNKFYTYSELVEYRYFVRFCIEKFLPSRFRRLTSKKQLLKILDFTGNIFNDIRLIIKKRKFDSKSNQYSYKINEIDAEIENFISEVNKNDFNIRGAAELKWILNFPWVIETAVDSEVAKKYYFLSETRKFRFICLKIMIDKLIIGFLIFRLRDNELKLQYYYYKPEYIENITYEIIKQVLESKADLFSCRDEEINANLVKFGLPVVHLRKNKKYVYLSNNLKDKIKENLKMHDGDGDNAFT